MPTFQGGIDWASIFAPLLAGEQTMMQNRQQQFENKRQQQNDTQNAALAQAQLQDYSDTHAKNVQAEDAATRNRGVDPATGKAFVMPQNLTQVRPNNKGKGGAPSDDETLAHLQALVNYYQSTGQTDKAQVASSEWTAIHTEKMRAQSEQESMLKAITLNNMTTDRDVRLNNMTSDRTSSDITQRMNDMISTLPLIFGYRSMLQSEGIDQRGQQAQATAGSKDAHKYANDLSKGVQAYIAKQIDTLSKSERAGNGPDNVSSFQGALTTLIGKVAKGAMKPEDAAKLIDSADDLTDDEKGIAKEAITMQAQATAAQGAAFRSNRGGSQAAPNPPLPYPNI